MIANTIRSILIFPSIDKRLPICYNISKMIRDIINYSYMYKGKRLGVPGLVTMVNLALYKTGIIYPLWKTKKEPFWMFLQLLLYEVQPKCLLEFGSGRSTSSLAEYANSSGATFLSFEESRSFLRKQKKAMEQATLPVRAYLRHLPIDRKRGGYNIEKYIKIIRRDLKEEESADFLFIDGPVGDNGRALRYLEPLGVGFGDVRLAIVDDINRPNSLEVANWVRDRWNLCWHTFEWRKGKKLAILSARPIKEIIESSCRRVMEEFNIE